MGKVKRLRRFCKDAEGGAVEYKRWSVMICEPRIKGKDIYVAYLP